MVDVRPFHQFFLPSAQVVEFRPQVGPEGVGTRSRRTGPGQEAVRPVILIQARYGIAAVLHPEPLPHIHHLGLAVLRLKRIGKGAAVPQQFGVSLFRMPYGEFSEKRNLASQRRTGQKRHGDRPQHIRFASDNVAFIRQHAVGRAGHGPDRQLHGRPAFRRYRVHLIFRDDLLVQQHEGIHLFQQRGGQIVNLVAAFQKPGAFLQLGVPFPENPVVFVHYHRQIHRYGLDAEPLQKLSLVEDHRAEGLGPQPHLRHPHPLKIFDHAAYRRKFLQTPGKDVVFHPAAFYVRKRDPAPLQLPRQTEQAALAVGIPGTVRLEHVIQRRKNQYRLAKFPGQQSPSLLVAEVAVEQYDPVHPLAPEPLRRRAGVLLRDQHVHRCDSLGIHETHAVVRKRILYVLHQLPAALFRLLPVENPRPRRHVPPDRRQPDFHLIFEHHRHSSRCLYYPSRLSALKWHILPIVWTKLLY